MIVQPLESCEVVQVRRPARPPVSQTTRSATRRRRRGSGGQRDGRHRDEQIGQHGGQRRTTEGHEGAMTLTSLSIDRSSGRIVSQPLFPFLSSLFASQ